MSLILVTGGAGYIGSHTCVELLQSGHDVVVVDNLCNGKAEALARVEQIAGRKLAGFSRVDVRDRKALRAVFQAHRFNAAIHFAALKAVGESVEEPLRYYDNNVGGAIALAEAMAEAGVRRLVFSSSATLYGDPDQVPIPESCRVAPTNPYGRTKWMVEQILSDLVAADPGWHVVLLRYFNPVGAHRSGRIGEDPCGIPNNLMPYISQVAVGRRDRLQVFGGDYPTADGTGVRDYIHVVDVARGHIRAVERIDALPAVTCLNLGTGRGHTVLEVVRGFEAASGRSVPYRIVERRPGDIAACWADPALAKAVLDWRPEYDLDAMCRDAWRWQAANPDGYPDG